MRLYFCNFENFGDALSPHLMQHLLRREVQGGTPANADIMAVGSIFFKGEYFFFERQRLVSRAMLKWLWYKIKALWQKPLVVWGSAFLHEPMVPKKCLHYRKLDIRAVRGEATRRLLMKAGFTVPTDTVLGDPGLFYPELLGDYRLIKKKYELAIVPGYNDFEKAKELWKKTNAVGIKTILIDVLQKDPVQTLREIAESRKVVASAMHALIVSDAMGIPNRGISFPSFNAWKVGDYYSAFGMTMPRVVDAEACLNAPENILAEIPSSPNVTKEQVEKVKSDLLRVLRSVYE